MTCIRGLQIRGWKERHFFHCNFKVRDSEADLAGELVAGLRVVSGAQFLLEADTGIHRLVAAVDSVLPLASGASLPLLLFVGEYF